jgi:rubrerythrin
MNKREQFVKALEVVGCGEIEMLECLDCGVPTEGYTRCPSCREYWQYIEQGGGVVVDGQTFPNT